MVSKWEKELPKLEELLTSGKTIAEVGCIYNVSRQRIEQLIKRYLPHLTKKDFGVGKRVVTRLKIRQEEIKRKFNREPYSGIDDLQKAMSAFFTRKRQNTKYGKWEWNIQMSDLEWPLFCPILGIELDWFAEKTKENSPSIDRLDPKKGYTPDNVVIMSWRANRLKNDGYSFEHKAIADYMKTFNL